MSYDELIRAVQYQNELLQALLSEDAASSRDRAAARVNDYHLTPPLHPVNSPPMPFEFQALSRPDRRLTFDATHAKHVPASIHSTNSDHQEDEPLFSPLPLLDTPPAAQPNPGQRNHQVTSTNTVTRCLEQMHLEDQDLLQYLRDNAFTNGAGEALQEFLKKRDSGPGIDWAASFRNLAQYENEGEHWNSTVDVYNVGPDGIAQPVPRKSQLVDDVDAPTMWDMIKDVNYPAGQTVGRIIIAQEPTALMLGAMHYALNKQFDMDEIYSHLATFHRNGGRTTSCMSRAFETDESPSSAPEASPDPSMPLGLSIRQRTFFFVFKYYAVVAQGHTSAPWERFDKRPQHRRSPDHIDIAECNSILALSLSGSLVQTSKRRQRRGKSRQLGRVFDTFGSWTLLNIQSFPDDEHTDRGESTGQELINGPFAFLDALVVEYRDAVNRNKILHEKITDLITPNLDFMFDVKIRDKLLFEDKNFTYIRRYFWAYMTLGVINTSIKSMIKAYATAFMPIFWEGRHPTLWPHPDPDSPAGQDYRTRLTPLRKELEAVLRELRDVQDRNERTRQEIQSLRDQLFAGSSIKESRRAIDQGDNIRILTLSSMIFLPLTFVTSVFGITEFTIAATNWRFPVTMVCVCVPFVVLLIILQSDHVKRRAANFGARLRQRWQKDAENPDPASPTAAGAENGSPRKRRRRVRSRDPFPEMSGVTGPYPAPAKGERGSVVFRSPPPIDMDVRDEKAAWEAEEKEKAAWDRWVRCGKRKGKKIPTSGRRLEGVEELHGVQIV